MSKAFDKVTERLVALMEADGAAPWHRPWNTTGLAQRSIRGRDYRGINQFMTAATARAEGYTDTRWLTFKQGVKLGGRLRGEKGDPGRGGVPVIGWDWPTQEQVREAEAAGLPRPRPRAFSFTVFNVDQWVGLDVAAEEAPEAAPFDPLEVAELLAAGYVIGGGPTLQHGGGAAFYRPSTDEVWMPDRDRFESAAAYYSTLFHELGHSTGHESRLNRKGIGDHAARFGDPVYSREELVAEMTAAFLCGHAGIDNEAQEVQSAAYLAGWLKVLREDSAAVVFAAGQAQRAADLIIGGPEVGEEVGKDAATVA